MSAALPVLPAIQIVMLVQAASRRKLNTNVALRAAIVKQLMEDVLMEHAPVSVVTMGIPTATAIQPLDVRPHWAQHQTAHLAATPALELTIDVTKLVDNGNAVRHP